MVLGRNRQSRVLAFPVENFLIDLFADYSYMKFNFHTTQGKVVRTSANFSGWSLGLSIGYAF